MKVRAVIERPVPRIAMSIDDLALSLGVSVNTVRSMVEAGALPRPHMWGRRRLWRVAEIDAALSEWPTDGDSQQGAEAPDEWRGRA